MKDTAIVELIEINRGSVRSTADQSAEEIAQFDSEYRIFRNPNGDSFSEQQVIAGTPRSSGHPEVIWRGIRVTIPASLDELCWAPYSIGDVIVDEREPGFPISNKIHSIEARIYADSAELVYIFANQTGMDHQYVCEKVNEGQFRIIAGGDQ
jgi:hypothetical protein